MMLPGVDVGEASDPLDRLAVALERLSSANLALSDASDRLAALTSDERAHEGLVQAAAASRRAARRAAEASARVVA